MKISDKQRQAACLYWAQVLSDAQVSEWSVQAFQKKLDKDLAQSLDHIDSLCFGYRGKPSDNLLQKAADNAMIPPFFGTLDWISMTFDDKDNLIVDGTIINADDLIQRNQEKAKAERETAQRTRNTESEVKENKDGEIAQANGGSRVKNRSGLLVTDLKGDDYERYQAYQWYLQGRARARRLATYSRLVKWVVAPLGLIPGVNFLIHCATFILMDPQEKRMVKANVHIKSFLGSCIPVLNLIVNYIQCIAIRRALQAEIDPFLNNYFNLEDKDIPRKDIAVDMTLPNGRIILKEFKAINDDLAQQNNLIIQRRLTEKQFKAYSHRSQDPKKVRAAETPEVKNKKLVQIVPHSTSRLTSIDYNIYMDQEQNNRFENRFQRLQLKKGENNPTFFNVPPTINPQSKSDSVKIIKQVMDMHKKAESPRP